MEPVEKKVEIPDEFLNSVVNPWLLGADPEFAVISPPNRTVKNAGATCVEVEEAPGEIGWDHGGRVWELRPAPSRSAYKVLTNLWRLLRHKDLSRVEQFKWKSGALGGVNTPTQAPQIIVGWQPNHDDPGNPVPIYGPDPDFDGVDPNGEDTLGGHVHFGLAGLNPAQMRGLGATTTALLNLDILPRRENSKRIRLAQSRGLSYGSLSVDAIRACNGHVEFRAAPSWLDKPGQALAALTSYKLAAVRPSSVTWADDFELKGNFLEWLEEFSAIDVDAYLLLRLINRQGFESIQADPSADFKPRWRREDLWAK